MKIVATEKGFSLSERTVTFDFISDRFPEEKDSLFTLSVCGEAPMPLICAGDRLILPVDEGIAIRADKEYDQGELDISSIGGTFCSREGTLGMLIVEREKSFLMIAPQNTVYATYSAVRTNGLYHLKLVVEKEMPVFYGVFGTLVEAAAYYREHFAKATVTLKKKIEKNPEILKLAHGAVFWVWQDNYDEVMYADRDTDANPSVGTAIFDVADTLQANGVDNALFGIFFNEDSQSVERLYQKYGYIATQYDNYNDVLDPAMLSLIPNNRVRCCDYTRRRMKDYPYGVQIRADGTRKPAWALRGFDGEMHPQNTLCPAVAAERIKTEIPQIIARYPCYKGRFIDVYGGCALSECYSKTHPATKEEILKIKKDAFAALGEMGLIAGTEDGCDGIADSLVYAEGLHSPVYFRNNDSGRKHAHRYTQERAAHIRKHMLDPTSRIPLFELVYHDCLLALPYWGDSTASDASLLKRKILFACLYGCVPLYSFFVKDFARLKMDILESYHRIRSVLQKVATLPMTDFTSLTEDGTVQRSVFGGRYEVVANFSPLAYRYSDKTVAPEDFYFGEL